MASEMLNHRLKLFLHRHVGPSSGSKNLEDDTSICCELFLRGLFCFMFWDPGKTADRRLNWSFL